MLWFFKELNAGDEIQVVFQYIQCYGSSFYFITEKGADFNFNTSNVMVLLIYVKVSNFNLFHFNTSNVMVLQSKRD